MDYEVRVIHSKRDVLEDAIRLAFKGRHTSIRGYRFEDVRSGNKAGQYEKALVFYWNDFTGVSPLIADLSVSTYADLITTWLSTVEYPKEPYTDGSTEKGFKLTTNAMAKCEQPWYVTFLVSPIWIIHGK